MRQIVLQKKTETEARKTEKTNQATDAERADALLKAGTMIIQRMLDHQLDPYSKINLALFRLILEQIRHSRTNQDIDEALKEL